MKIYNVQNYNPNFTAIKPKEIISKPLLDRFGLNIETMVGYKGEKTIAPPPQNINPQLADYLNKLQVDWNTHISKTRKKFHL